MLNVIHRNVCRKAVLEVGVGPCFYGFSMEKQLFWPISCTCLTKQSFQMIADPYMNILKIVFTVSSDNSCSVRAVDPRNKKKEGRRRWRNGHILQSVKNHETRAFHLNN